MRIWDDWMYFDKPMEEFDIKDAVSEKINTLMENYPKIHNKHTGVEAATLAASYIGIENTATIRESL